MRKYFNKIYKVNGKLPLSGDKSISHRAIIFSSMAKGKSVVTNISSAQDVNTTITIMRLLGVKITSQNKLLLIDGCGYKGFQNPGLELNCENSGTTARLLAGLLSAQKFKSILTGDESLSKRPMKRIIDPLMKMGAEFKTNENSTLPLIIYPANEIQNIEYEMPVASAQVKSSILIAGLHNESDTIIIENQQTRDHTEKMLGLPVCTDKDKILSYSSKKYYPQAKEYFIPGDISSAAFHIVLTLLTPNSELMIENVSLNPTRIGFVNLLRQMGADIYFENIKSSNNEEYGDVLVKSSSLKNIKIDKTIIPNIIDEIPILTIAGIFAEGDFEIDNVQELRVKESDRIKSICENLKLVGLKVDESENGFKISGTIKNREPIFDSYNDHRIAMAFSVCCMLLDNGGAVENYECVSVSNPQFDEQINLIVS